VPSDKPPIKTPGELARGEEWPKPVPEPDVQGAIAAGHRGCRRQNGTNGNGANGTPANARHSLTTVHRRVGTPRLPPQPAARARHRRATGIRRHLIRLAGNQPTRRISPIRSRPSGTARRRARAQSE